MRVYNNLENDNTMYIGYGYEIMPMARSMIKHERKCYNANRPCYFGSYYYELPKNMLKHVVHSIIIYPDGEWEILWPSRTCAEVLRLNEGSDF